VDYDVAEQSFVGAGVKLYAPIQPFGHVRLYKGLQDLYHDQLVELAKDLNLPTHGVVPTVELLEIVASTMQTLWYQQVSPQGIPDHVFKRHEERLIGWQTLVSNLKEGLVMATKTDGKKTAKEATQSATTAPAKRSKNFTYSLASEAVKASKRAKVFENKESKNHDAIIVQCMAAYSKPQPPETIADKVRATNRYTTKDDFNTSVRWHLNKLEKEGLVHAFEVEAPAKANKAAAPAAETAEVTA
jgi:hypothetical protein